jgi:hypothetical protein
LTVTEQRLMELGAVAVTVEADDPHPAEKAAVAANAAEPRRNGRITIGYSYGRTVPALPPDSKSPAITAGLKDGGKTAEMRVDSCPG